jgi:hypothetical protein
LSASFLQALIRNFCHCVKVTLDADAEKVFVDELRQRGFAAEDTGWVYGLVLTEDLAAALWYERAAYRARVR